MSKKTIVFDFDGVIHKGYDGWRDGTIYGEINYELLYFIKDLLKDYYVVISSNRPAEQIVEYLNKDCNNPLYFEVFKKDFDKNMYWNKDNVVGVTNEKAVGILYIDDRSYRYDKHISTNMHIEHIKNILNIGEDYMSKTLEDLGYETDSTYEIEGHLYYCKDHIKIDFDLGRRDFYKYNFGYRCPISMPELKAIYEFCKEKGWLNE